MIYLKYQNIASFSQNSLPCPLNGVVIFISLMNSLCVLAQQGWKNRIFIIYIMMMVPPKRKCLYDCFCALVCHDERPCCLRVYCILGKKGSVPLKDRLVILEKNSNIVLFEVKSQEYRQNTC